MFEKHVKRNGLVSPVADYSLSFIGPGKYFRTEAAQAKSAALELFVALTEAPSIAPSAKGRPNGKLKAVIAQMEAHPERDYPVERIAAEAAMSPVLFTDAFKRATGLTPHAFLLDVRVARAREELTRSGRSIAAVAERYHFPSARHFATMFRRIVGMSPSAVKDCDRFAKGFLIFARSGFRAQ